MALMLCHTALPVNASSCCLASLNILILIHKLWLTSVMILSLHLFHTEMKLGMGIQNYEKSPFSGDIFN